MAEQETITLRNKKTGEIITVPKNQYKDETNYSKGFSGIGSDIAESLSSTPEALGEMLTSIPGNLKKSFRYDRTHNALQTAANLGGGAVEAVAQLASAPQVLTRYLAEKFPSFGKSAEKSMRGMGIGTYKDPTLNEALINFEKKHGLAPESEDESAIRGVGGLIGGGVGLLKLPNLATQIAALSAQQAGAGGDPIHAALLGALTEGALKGASKIPNLSPQKFLRGNLSAQELADNLRATQGTETGLGDVIQSPGIKRFLENTAPNFPYSGADEPMIRTGNAIREKGSQLIDQLTEGSPPENTGQALLDALKKTEQEVKNTKNKKWNAMNELAEKHNVTTDRSKMRRVAQEELDKIQSDPDLSLFRSPSDIKLLEELSSPSKNNKNFSLKESSFLRGELGNKAFEASMSGDVTKQGLYKKLKEAITDDINSSIKKSDVKSLKDARDEAMRYHKDEYAAFKDRDIEKFTRRGGDPDQIVNFFLRTGRLTDRANLLQKLLRHLPREQKGLLPYAYFSNALEDGQINPNSLNRLYTNLGERQREVLFPDKSIKQAFDDYSNLVGKNKDALSPMFNPKTGARTGSAAQMLSQILAAGAGFAHGGAPEAIAAGAAFHVLPGLAMRPFVKLLTNPNFRKSIVEKMIKNESDKPSPNAELIKNLANKLSENARALTIAVNQQNQEGKK